MLDTVDTFQRPDPHKFSARTVPDLIRKWTFSRCKDGRHIENRLLAIITAIYCPINAKFCVKKQNNVQTQVTWPKYQILKTQDGGRPPFWKWFYRYISAENHPISMKFDMQTEILVPRTVTCWFIKIWNSKWRSAALLKIVFWQYLHELLSDWSDIWYVQVEPCYISAAYHRISMKFCVPLQILVLRTVTWPSVKFKMANDRHIENRLLAIS